MSDVSCRVFTYFHAAERAGWIDIEQLLEGFPLSRAYLETPGNRVPWALWRQLCERSARQLGSPERIRDSGAFAVNETIAGFLGPALGLFSSPRDIYRVAFRWLCPSIYRSHSFTYKELGDGRLELGITLRDGHEGCLSYMQMFEGGLRAGPRFVKSPDAIVQATVLTDRTATFLVTLPARRTLASRLGRLVRASTTSSEIEAELTFQQQQLLATHESLRTSERSFRSVLDALPALIAIARAGRIVYVNPAMATALGSPADELVGTPLDALIAPEDRRRFDAMLIDGRRDLGNLEELRMRSPAGAEREVAALGLRDVTFEGEAAIGLLAVDLTERHQIEARLQHSEETMHALMTTMPDLIARVRGDGVLLDTQAGTVMGRASRFHEARGRSMRDLVGLVPGLTEDLITRGLRVGREALDTNEVRQFDTEVSYEDGSSRAFELRIVPIATRREVLVIVRDVTRRRTEERQLAISDRLISLGTLAAGVAHEINNPLTYVMGSLSELDHGLDLLRDGGKAIDIAALQAALDQAREGVARVTTIVRSLSGMSRIDSRKVEPVDVHDLLEQAIAITAHEIRQSARLVRSYHAVGAALADRVQLVQVLVNLLANAVQAIPAGQHDRNEIRLVTGDAGDRVWIEVHDSGVGIAPADRQHIFDPFFTTKPHGRGTGLGLSISHRIVHDLGGRLSLESEVGIGSVFRVELPMTAQRPADAERVRLDTPPSQAAVMPDGVRLLIVDDEPALAEVIRRMLHGCDATAVHSGRAALEHLAAHPECELVICDMSMPDLTGVDVYQEAIRLRPELATRFLFICGGVTTEQVRRFLEDSERPVLWKPFAPQEMQRRVQRALTDAAKV